MSSSSSSSQSASPPPSSKKRKRETDPLPELSVDITAPEPPSKKALRKAKKGKATSSAAPAVKSTFDTQEPNSERQDVVPAPTTLANLARSAHGVWIGNLPFAVTRDDVKAFLKEHGGLAEEQITRVHIPMQQRQGKSVNKGFAYVDFASAESVKTAIGLSEKLLKGRRVLIKDKESFEGRPAENKDAVGKDSGKPKNKKIFVGNLSFDTTEQDLREHYAKCGTVANVFMTTFEDSGKCKGFAWVEFDSIEAAEKAIRGWVEWEHDGKNDSEDEEDIEDVKKDTKPKKQTRKWWVNRMKGRALRMEYAEDATTRYKKRYGGGKDGERGNTSADTITEVEDSDPVVNTRASKPDSARKFEKRDNKGFRSNGRPEKKIDARTIKPGAALAAAPRLTGAIVEGKGKKIMFD